MLTERRDLRGGISPWEDGDPVPSDPLPSATVDVAIVGAGVMGSMIAHRLAGADRTVALLDRRSPGQGATFASTALVLWAMDVPLTKLAERIGASDAARAWRRVKRAVDGLATLVDREDIDADRIPRPELYLDGNLLDEDGLVREGEARRAAGLPSMFLDPAETARRFRIAARPALLSDDAWEVDPARLTRALLDRARDAGATVTHPADVVALSPDGTGVALTLADGRTLRAGTAIIAGGYERAPLLLPAAFEVGSSYAIATAPGTAPLWNENAMIWEAGDPYLYARATADGRIIAGGEDEDFDDEARRDALIGAKAGTLAAKLGALVGDAIAVDVAWTAHFGSSPDGLPAIGRARNLDHVWLASGFGGNGVSFAALAAALIEADLGGRPDPDAALFDPYRFSRS